MSFSKRPDPSKSVTIVEKGRRMPSLQAPDRYNETTNEKRVSDELNKCLGALRSSNLGDTIKVFRAHHHQQYCRL